MEWCLVKKNSNNFTFTLWNQQVQTDRDVANKPDIIIKNKADEIYLLMDMSMPSDRNVIQNEAKSKLEYKL
jgi:hypothetical protein